MEQTIPSGTPHGGKPVTDSKRRERTFPPGRSHRLDWPLWILSAAVVGFALHSATFFFVWVTSAFMLFALVDPGVERLQRQGIAPAISALFLIAILCGGIGLLILLLYYSVEGVARDLETYRDVLRTLLKSLNQEIMKWLHLTETTAEKATHHAHLPPPAMPVAAAGNADVIDLSGSFGSTVLYGLTNAFTLISFLFLTPLLTFFLILERQILAQAIVYTLSLERREIVVFWRRITDSASGFFFGNVILLGISLPVFLFLFLLFDVTSPLKLATISSLLNLIPFIGAVAAGVFPSLNVLVHGGSPVAAISLYLLCMIVHFMFANIITPKAIGDRLELNATTSLIAAIGVGELWGIAGLILGIPLVAILKTFMEFSRSPEAQWMAAFMSNKTMRRNSGAPRVEKDN